jgi:hypothetical protein
MLTHAKYHSLWVDPAPHGFNQVTPVPNYHEYVLRSIYLQDYIDLFTKVQTFVRVNIGGEWYIQISSSQVLSNLAIPTSEQYTIRIEGVDYLRVAYDFPWTPEELNSDRRIKYIMVGEAARPSAAQTYFYNITETNNTHWLNAPIDAFQTLGAVTALAASSAKKEKLLFLANNGYILLDLFPFSLDDYAPLRGYLNLAGISVNFFKNHINRMLRNFESNGLLSDKVMLAFSGPGIIHHFLADEISIGNLFIMPNKIICRAYENHFDSYSSAILISPTTMIQWPKRQLLNGIYPAGTLSQVPFYRCCCYYVGGNYAPHTQLIQNAFF